MTTYQSNPSNLASVTSSKSIRTIRHPLTHLPTQAIVETLWVVKGVNIGLKLRLEDGANTHLSYSEIHKLER